MVVSPFFMRSLMLVPWAWNNPQWLALSNRLSTVSFVFGVKAQAGQSSYNLHFHDEFSSGFF